MENSVKKVLGINVGHDGGCTLVVDGMIAATMAEERLNRVKNSYGWLNSLKYCLEKTNTNLSEIDLVVFSDYNDKLKSSYTGGLELLGFPASKCILVDHHLSHACTAHLTSGFEESIVLVIDGRGNENSTESIYRARGTDIKKIMGNDSKNYMKGLVAAYQAFTSYFGWHQDEAGKTMGLAPYGNPEIYRSTPLFDFSSGWPRNLLSNNTALGLEEFLTTSKIDAPKKFSSDPLVYVDLAAWLQEKFEEALLFIVDKAAKETGVSKLCMAGGGALNSVTNTLILQKTSIKNLHVFPASGDSGQSIGNALFGYYLHSNPTSDFSGLYWKNDYRVDGYSDESIESMLQRTSEITELIIAKAPRYEFQKLSQEEIIKSTAKDIADGKIVGWFTGGSELGPRALGHRSILCDTRQKDMKDVLNMRVKHRESFRPFAASVLLEDTNTYFDVESESRFMLLVVDVKEVWREKLPAITHIDGTCRVQTVTKEYNGSYYDLINEYKSLTGIGLVLDTSFNLAGEPIVETPFDALKCFLKTQMDVLIIENYRITKK